MRVFSVGVRGVVMVVIMIVVVIMVMIMVVVIRSLQAAHAGAESIAKRAVGHV